MVEQGTDAERRLIESEARYRAVIENASDMIQSVNVDGTFEFVNRAWLEKLGYAPEEVPGLNIWDIIHPDSRQHCESLFARALGGDSIEHVRATFVTKDGRAIPVEGNATARFEGDRVIATHSFFRDLTERLRADELAERNEELERERVARYLEKMAALGKLAAGLAHELNNPAAAAQRAAAQLEESLAKRDAATVRLNALGLSSAQWAALEAVSAFERPEVDTRGPLELSEREDEIDDWLAAHGMRDGWELASALAQASIEDDALERIAEGLPPEGLLDALTWLGETLAIRDLVRVVDRSSHRISELVNAVKAYSYMDRAAEQVVDVHEGLDNTLIILGHGLKGMSVRREYDHSLPRVRAFGSGLNQVWTNIIDNSIDALGGAGTLTVRTRREGDRAVVEIEDDGPGIAPEHLTRIFEPFFSTKPQGLGNGLGLDIAWRIITEEHGGTIDVESQPGRTRFIVRLPFAAGD